MFLLEPRRPGQYPLVFVHGFYSAPTIWANIANEIMARPDLRNCFQLVAYRYPTGRPFVESAAVLRRELNAFVQTYDSQAEDPSMYNMAVVAHSMGGLASRAYLRRHGCGRVTTLITLASPHHGTLFARLIPGRNARQMEPDNDWIRQLSDQESFAVPVVSIWGAIDEFMVPQDSSRLANARDTAFATLGHLSMLFSPAVLQRLQAELEKAEQRQ